MSVSGAWDLLSRYRKDQSAVGRPGLRQAELKLCLVRVKMYCFWLKVSFQACREPSLGNPPSGTLRDNDLGLFGSKEH